MIDYKRNNKITLRNFNKKVDLHDLIKTLLVRMLRRKHPDNNKCQIYTEFNLDSPNTSYPDVYMCLTKGLNNEVYVYEIQGNYSKKWLKSKQLEYENVNLFIPINLNEVRDEWNKLIKEDNTDILELLRNILDKYIL